MQRITAILAAGIAALAAGCERGEAVSSDEADGRAEAVAAAIAVHQARFEAAPPPSGDAAYQFEFEGLSTDRVPMSAFQGDVVMVVNTASRCGLTGQYEGLQALYEEFGEQGFAIVGVPSGDFMGQELATAEEIREFCTMNFGVTFPMAGRTRVTGNEAHPFYRWARDEMGDDAIPRWNFHKLLLNRNGELIGAFSSRTEPDAPEVRAAIEAAIRS